MSHNRVIVEAFFGDSDELECTCGKSFGPYDTPAERDQANLAFHRHEIECSDDEPEAA